MKKSSVKTLQIISQVLLLAVFIGLAAAGKIQIWMAIFLGSLVLSAFFGRFYCGWICPIRTIQRPLTFIKKKLKLKDYPGPRFLRNTTVRSIVLALFLITMAFVLISGRRLPVLPALLGIGVLISILFSERLWHRWLCPYGALLAIPAGRSKKNLHISQSDCISCGACDRACPAEAIQVHSADIQDTALNEKQKKVGKIYSINASECLLCLECDRKCPTKTIQY